MYYKDKRGGVILSKKIEEMTDHEILLELIKEKRMRDKIMYVKIGFYSVILIALIILGCIYIPKIVAFVNRVNEDIERIEHTIDEIEENMNTLKEYGEDFYENTLTKITENVQKMEGTISEIKENINNFKISGQDVFDSTVNKLSKSVEDLRKMIPFIN